MAKFCKNCGATLKDGVKFCRGCGANIGGIAGQARNDVGGVGIPPVGDAPQRDPLRQYQPQTQQLRQTQYQQPPQQYGQQPVYQQPPMQYSQQRPVGDAPLRVPQPQQQYQQPYPPVGAASGRPPFPQYPQKPPASHGQRASAGPDPRRGPFVFSWQTLKGTLAGIATLFKKPSALLPMIVIIALQTALSFIKIGDPMNGLVTFFSFLTFAQGGMYAGFVGAVGGIIGRGIFAWAVSSIVMAMFSRGKKRQKPPAPKIATYGVAARAILGFGLGLVAYNFLTGDASFENALIGVTCAFACFRAAKRKQGYMTGLISSFTAGRLTPIAVCHIVSGIAIGMVAGTLSSLAVSGYWCYLVGAVIALIGLIFTLLGKNAPRVAAGMVATFIIAAHVMPFALSSYAMGNFTSKSENPPSVEGFWSYGGIDEMLQLAMDSAPKITFSSSVDLQNPEDKTPMKITVPQYSYDSGLMPVEFDPGYYDRCAFRVPQLTYEGHLLAGPDGFEGEFKSQRFNATMNNYESRSNWGTDYFNYTFSDCVATLQVEGRYDEESEDLMWIVFRGEISEGTRTLTGDGQTFYVDYTGDAKSFTAHHYSTDYPIARGEWGNLGDDDDDDDDGDPDVPDDPDDPGDPGGEDWGGWDDWDDWDDRDNPPDDPRDPGNPDDPDDPPRDPGDLDDGGHPGEHATPAETAAVAAGSTVAAVIGGAAAAGATLPGKEGDGDPPPRDDPPPEDIPPHVPDCPGGPGDNPNTAFEEAKTCELS